jgi:lysyl-tRNA synthetase class II
MIKKIVCKKGNVTALRYFGSIAFGYLDGKLRFSLRKDNLGDSYNKFKETVNLGDQVKIFGTMCTKFGEKLIEVRGIL